MAEYRLQDLARVSGVSARNIRAYRERGLLDPPRRVGRSALYDDYHLSQLNTISELLAKGFTSTHIAEFFTSMRQGSDLADILGLQRAMLGPRTNATDDRGKPFALAPDSEEARKLVRYGLAEIVGGRLVIVDGSAGDALTGSADRVKYIRALLQFIEATDDALDDLARAYVSSLTESQHMRVRTNYLSRHDETDELRQVVQNHRALGEKALLARFDKAVRRFMMTSAADSPAGLLLDGAWETKKAE